MTIVAPSQQIINDFHQTLADNGFHTTYPIVNQFSDHAVMTFDMKKGSPIFIALIGLLPTVITGALIFYAVNQISNISQSVLPVLLTVGGIGIAIAAIAGYSPHAYKSVEAVSHGRR